jgi:SAM-dependent methyltransferase
VYAAFLPAASRSRARDAIDGRIRDVVWSAVAPLIAPLARTRPGLVAVDLGSGEGNDVAALRDALGPAACLVAIDLRPGALQALRRSGLPAQPVVAHASRLPFADGRVDLVLQSTMLSSVLSAVRRAAITGEIRRVLGPGGLFVSLDMRLPSPRNRNIQPIRRAELGLRFAIDRPGAAAAEDAPGGFTAAGYGRGSGPIPPLAPPVLGAPAMRMTPCAGQRPSQPDSRVVRPEMP